jgi:hypothetical protein
MHKISEVSEYHLLLKVRVWLSLKNWLNVKYLPESVVIRADESVTAVGAKQSPLSQSNQLILVPAQSGFFAPSPQIHSAPFPQI